MNRLHLDFETFSEVDLRKVGLSRYARDPSTEVTLLAWAINHEPVGVVRFAQGERAPIRLREALRDPCVIKTAWNAAFERLIMRHVLGLNIPPEQWQCMMVLAYTLSLPGSLDKAGEVIGLPSDQQKMSRGKLLVRKFCAPRKPTKNLPHKRATHETDPEDWEEFVNYCARDVEAERAFLRRTWKWNLPPHEWRLWCLDQRINDAGIPINMTVVRNAVRLAETVVEDRLRSMSVITGLDNPNSTQQLLPWLQANGYPFHDLRKGHVIKAATAWDAENGASFRNGYRKVLSYRLEVSKSSTKKYKALLDRVDLGDDHIRGTLQFAGAARTWRWAGRNGYQPQNLARPVWYLQNHQEMAVKSLELLDPELIEMVYEKPMDLLSTCVRPVAQAPSGKVFLDADLNAIENRVLGWLAGDDKILGVFRSGRCPYVDFASYMFHQPYERLWEEYKAGDKTKRTTAKPAVLGCGYMLGPGEEKENEETGEIEATGLLGYARGMGVHLTPEESKLAVDTWRGTFTSAVNYWYDLDRAAREVIITGEPQRVGTAVFDISGPFMRIRLPSGRHLHYCRPRIEDRKTPWGELRPTVTYEGMNDRNQWARLTTHPGKLTENVDQAIARDVLANGLTLAARRGLDVRLHVHDQIVVLADEDKAEEQLKVLIDCMSHTPEWAPGLPLSAEGTISRIFIKD